MVWQLIKKLAKIKKFVEVPFVGTVIVGTVFVVSIISSKVITESSTLLAKYLPFLQLYVSGFQI